MSLDDVSAAIGLAMRSHGPDGCTGRMAQEFGDHPDEARDRMRWARRLIGQMPGAAACAA